MSKPPRPIRGKKLLVATVGAGALTFVACAVFPACNLMAPPSCEKNPNQFYCGDMGVADADIVDGGGDLGDGGGAYRDGGDGGPTDGSHD